MDYLHRELDLNAGEVVEVKLDHAANVQLLDPDNFRAYEERRPFRYFGGYATQSPFRIVAPRPGKWHLVIDLGGGPGTVRACVAILSSAAAS